MHPEDRVKTAFSTNQGLYCYTVMSIDLKNAGVTYQRQVNKMFQGQIGRSMEVYVDNMLMKSLESLDHTHHPHEVFTTLKQYEKKLNSAKCALEYPLESSWDTWSQTEELRPIPRRSKLSWKYSLQGPRNSFSNSLEG